MLAEPDAKRNRRSVGTSAWAMPLGSCRVHNALRVARSAKGLDINLEDQYGFVYNSKEVLQQIRYMRGEIAFPDLMERLIHWGEQAPRKRARNGFAAHRYLVEISSRKTLEFNGVFPQAPRVNTMLSEAGGAKMFAHLWLDKTGDAAAVRQKISAEVGFEALPEEWRQFLMSVRLTFQPPDELLADMRLILDLLGHDKVTFVSHCDASGRTGALIPDRHAFIGEVAAAAQVLGVRFFDPSPYLAEFGQARGFGRDGGDTEHYTPEFEAFLADHFTTKLLANG
jgi:hypothetical protein